MKAWIAAATLLLSLASPLAAAISVAWGETRLTFDTQPHSNDWRSASVEGGISDINTAAEMDSAVQALSAAEIGNALPATTTPIPSQFNYARWNSAGLFLQSRVGNNRFAPLLAILRNDSGTFLQWIELSYDLATGGTQTEQLPGFRVYFSLTGEPNSWVPLPSLSTGSPGRWAAVLNLIPSPWNAGAECYLLWADDNGGGPDAYYTIDNLTIATAPRLAVEPRPDGTVEVSWTEGWSATLEATPSLSSPDWRAVTEPWTVSGGRFRVIVTPANARFFRLTAPNI